MPCFSKFTRTGDKIQCEQRNSYKFLKAEEYKTASKDDSEECQVENNGNDCEQIKLEVS